MIELNAQRFAALGTEVEGALGAESASGQRLWQQIRETVGHFASRFSRFSPASELSQLNAQAGTLVKVSPEMMMLLDESQKMWQATKHLVDPSIGYAVISAGYDKSFELLSPVEHRPTAPMKMVRANFALLDIRKPSSQVKLPIGVSIDFGGLGKGYLLDQLVPMIEQVTTNYWLSLGGDMMVSGTAPDGSAWPIGVQDPQHHEQDWATLSVPPGRWAVATSGTTKRKGIRNDVAWHHIIDPRTGRPSTSDVVAATVIAPTGLAADAFAKTVLLQGSDAGVAWAQQQADVEALIITATGESKMTTGMKELLTIR